MPDAAEPPDVVVVDDPFELPLVLLDEAPVDELEELEAPPELELVELAAGVVGWKVSLAGPKPMFDAEYRRDRSAWRTSPIDSSFIPSPCRSPRCGGSTLNPLVL